MNTLRFSTVALAVILGFGLTSATSAEELKGRVRVVSSLARTIAVEVENKGVILFKYDASTQFKNTASAKDIIPDEVVAVDFSQVGPEYRAKTVTKVIAPLPAGVMRIAAEELQAMISKGGENLVLIDSRPTGRFNEGHLPRAVSIPLNELEKDAEKLLPSDRAKTLVFYCGGLSCALSPKSAVIAVKLGFKDVRVYPEGEPGWKKLEYPTEPSLSFVKSANLVLVDLRSAEKAAAGYIPRSVNIPAASLSKAEKQFPDWHAVPIVFYSDSEEDLKQALELSRDWEYKNATVFPGGVKAWQAAGNALATGVVPTKISFVRKLAEGEVSIADFEENLKTQSYLVIDARTSEEFAKGHFAGAVNLPAEEIAGRYAEIPAGKPVLLHCSTGTRSELAYDVLKEKGVKSRYLRANVEFAAGNKFAIKE